MQGARAGVLDYVARSGYVARAMIYLTIGVMAIWAWWGGQGGVMTDSKGAIQILQEQSFGTFLLVFLVVGLIGYSIWRLIQGLFDADRHGTNAKGMAIRFGLLVSAGTHLALAYFCWQLIQNGSSDSGTGQKQLVAQALAWPLGQLLVALIAVAVIGFGLSQIVKAINENYKRYMEFPRHREVFDAVSKAGLIARGIVFGIIGSALMYAAYTYDPGQAMGLNQVWVFLKSQTYGSYLVLTIAVGLLLFGVYSSLEAIYRRVESDIGSKIKI